MFGNSTEVPVMKEDEVVESNSRLITARTIVLAERLSLRSRLSEDGTEKQSEERKGDNDGYPDR